jgi:hypothetical protein
MIYGNLLIRESSGRILVFRSGSFLHEASSIQAAKRWIDAYNAPLPANRAVRYITDWEV